MAAKGECTLLVVRARAHLNRLALVLFSSVLASHPARATETDQFTVPKRPLYDIGPQLSRKIAEILEADRSGEDPERVLSEWVGHKVLSSRVTHWVKDLRPEDGPVGFRPNIL